jgi:hypothetical protein
MQAFCREAGDMNRRARTVLSTALVAVLLAGTAIGGARAQTAPKYGENLVVNGDAEAELGAPDYNKIVKPSSWTTTGEFTVVRYGASGGFPDATTPGPAERGKSLFEGGNTPKSTASQTVSLAPFAADIDAGLVTYTFSAYIGGYSSQADNAVVSVQYLDTRDAAVGGAELGPVTPADRQSKTSLLARTKSGPVPKGTRKAVVSIVITRAEGKYNDGSVDNITLVLAKSQSPSP